MWENEEEEFEDEEREEAEEDFLNVFYEGNA